MKKHLIIPFAAAFMLASCAGDELIEGAADGVVTFTAQLPAEISSRAFADGTTATTLQYAVFEVDGTQTKPTNVSTPDVTIADLKATVSLKLIKGKTYNVAFWASAYGSDATNSPYTFSKESGTITVATTGDANAEARDAFFGTSGNFTVDGVANRTVTLTRPFAQINIGTNDLTDFRNNGGSISTSGMTITAPTRLNLLTGDVIENSEKPYTFSPAQISAITNTFPVEGNTYLTMNYVLVGKDKTTLSLTWTSDNAATASVPFTAIPVQRNYRTNIYGALLTAPSIFDVTIDKNINDSHPAEYEDGFRVAHTQDEVNNLFAEGVDKVVIDGSVLTNPSTTPAAQTMSRAGNGIVEFVLNKAVEHQWLKIKGQAACGISVRYGNETTGAAENPQFTLLVNKIPSVAINLPDAAVEVKGVSGDTNDKAEIENVEIVSAGTIDVDTSTVTVPDVTADDVTAGGIVAVFNETEEIAIPATTTESLHLLLNAKVGKISLPASLSNPVTIEIAKDVDYPEFEFTANSTLKDLTIKSDPTSSKSFKGFVFHSQGNGAMPVTHNVKPDLFENLKLDGLRFDNGGFAPQYAVKTQNTVIRNCVFMNMKATAVASQNSGSTDNTYTYGMTIENCEVTFANDAAAGQNAFYLVDVADSVIVKNNTIKNSTYIGITIDCGTNTNGYKTKASKIEVTGNTVTGCKKDGIKITNEVDANITVSSNTVAVKENGIRLKNAIGGNAVVITNNAIDMKDAIEFKDGEPCGILLINENKENETASKLTVTGNTVANSNGHSLSLVNINKTDDSQIQSDLVSE